MYKRLLLLVVFEDLRKIDMIERLRDSILLLLCFFGSLILFQISLTPFQGSWDIRPLLISYFAQVICSFGLFLLSYCIESVNNLGICFVIYGLSLVSMAKWSVIWEWKLVGSSVNYHWLLVLSAFLAMLRGSCVAASLLFKNKTIFSE